MGLEEYALPESQNGCRELLFQWRKEQGLHCPRCGGCEFYFHKKRYLAECKECGKQISPTSNTIFHGFRNLKSMFIVIDKFTKGIDVSAAALSRETGASYETSWNHMHIVRQAISEQVLAGAGTDVPLQLLIPALNKMSSVSRAECQPELDEIERSRSEVLADGFSDHGSRMAELFVQFLLFVFQGVSRKHAQKYADELSFKCSDKSWDVPSLAKKLIRAMPLCRRRIHQVSLGWHIVLLRQRLQS